MLITKTLRAEREILRNAGFVHLTGLNVFDGQGHCRTFGEEVKPEILGTYDFSETWMTVVTMGGEVWATVPADTTSSARGLAIKVLCPNEQKKHTFPSLFDLKPYDVLCRVAKPDWGI